MQSQQRDRYLNEIRKALRQRPNKEEMVSRIQSDMEEYLAANPDASMEELRIVFGRPEDYMKEYVAGMNRQKIYNTVTSKWRRNLICLIASVSILVISFCILAFSLTAIRMDSNVYYYCEEIVDHGIIDEEDIIEQGTVPSLGEILELTADGKE